MSPHIDVRLPGFCYPFHLVFNIGPATSALTLSGAYSIGASAVWSKGMRFTSTALRDIKLLTPKHFHDDRGWFAETFNALRFGELGLPASFAQDNQSFSTHGVLRGLHYQLRQPQGKLVRVLSGHIWDVVVDLRRHSPEFGRWAAFELGPRSPEGTLEMLWVPEGYAHGFLVLSPSAEVLYKVTRPYDPGSEHTLCWNDPEIGIPWPLHRLNGPPLLSPKDARGKALGDAALFDTP